MSIQGTAGDFVASRVASPGDLNSGSHVCETDTVRSEAHRHGAGALSTRVIGTNTVLMLQATPSVLFITPFIFRS